MNMLHAWHNRPELKSEIVDRVHAHVEAGSLRPAANSVALDSSSAVGWSFGSLLSCLITDTLADERAMTIPEFITTTREGRKVYWQVDVERICGIPYAVNELLDLCFKSRPQPEAANFAVEAIEAIAVGADLSLVPAKLTLDLLIGDGKDTIGVIQHIENLWGRRAAADQVVTLYQRMLSGDAPSKEEWDAATGEAHLAAGIIGGDVPSTEDRDAASGPTVEKQILLTSHAAGYAVYAASAQHACIGAEVQGTKSSWHRPECTAAHAAAYTAWAAQHAPHITAGNDDVATYGDPPYCYATHTTFFSELLEPQKTFAATDACQEHFQWRANRMVHHLTCAS